MIRKFVHFFLLCFSHYLGAWIRLIYTWRNFECPMGKKISYSHFLQRPLVHLPRHPCHNSVWYSPRGDTPQKIPTQIKLPKPNFSTQKNPGIENFKPKKILRSSPSLEIPSTPKFSSRKACVKTRWTQTSFPPETVKRPIHNTHDEMECWNTLTKKIFFVVSQTRSQSLRYKENSAIMGFFYCRQKW